MTPDYQFYHGALLHEIITTAGREVRIELRNLHGRADAYVLDGTVGLLIKHSALRITPFDLHVRERTCRRNTSIAERNESLLCRLRLR